MPQSLRPVIRFAILLAAILFPLTTFLRVQPTVRSTEIDAALLGCAAFVVAEVHAPELPTPDQVAAACNHCGDIGPLRFRAVPGTLTPAPGVIAAVVVHQPPFDGPLVGLYSTGTQSGCELTQDRVVHVLPHARLKPEEVGPTDQILWLVPR